MHAGGKSEAVAVIAAPTIAAASLLPISDPELQVRVEGLLAPGDPHAVVSGGDGPIGIRSMPAFDSLTTDPRPLSGCRSHGFRCLWSKVVVEGQVVARFRIDSLGRAIGGSIKIVESAHPSFDAAVREAVLRGRYRPGRVGGRAVEVDVVQTFVFRLPG